LDDEVERTWQEWLSETTKNVRITDIQVCTQNPSSAKLLTSHSMKTPSSAHVFQA